MYFETGVDCLRGILSPGAYYLRGGLSPGHIVSPGAYHLRDGLSLGHIVSEAYCLGAGCLQGGLSPGQIVFWVDYLRADCLGHIVLIALHAA